MKEHPAVCAREIRHRVLSAGQLPAEAVAQIQACCGVSLLRAHRLAHGWTLTETATRLRAQVETTGRAAALVGHQRISKWENGHEAPSGYYLDALCQLFQTRPDRLGFGHDYSTPGTADPHPATGGEPPDRSNLRDEMRRRELLGSALKVTGAQLSLAALTEIEAVRRSIDHSLLSCEVGPALVDRWERNAHDHGFRYRTTAITQMLADTTGDLAEVQRLLGQRQPLDQQRQLLRVHAQLAGLIALLFSDLGRRAEMRQWFQTAQLAADETGDRALRAWLLAKEAKADLENGGSPDVVLNEATHAIAIAGKAPSAGALIAITMQARASGALGRLNDVGTLNRAAERIFDRLPAEETSSSVYAMSAQQFHLYLANAWRTAGDPGRSMPHYQRSLEMFPRDEPLDPVLTRIEQATALVQNGQVDAGCRQAIRELTSVPAEWRTPLMRDWGGQTLSAVPVRHRNQVNARELHQVLRSFQLLGPT